MTWALPLILASSSPRRRQLLEERGWPVTCLAPHVDDGRLSPQGIPGRQWVTAMAWFKARSVMLQHAVEGTILAADTVCEHRGRIFGQPANRAEAADTLRRLRQDRHQVMTGVCLLCPRTQRRELFVDEATVTLGAVDDEMIDRYLETDRWRGKAGGYNLHDRIADGWPVTWTGDDDTITGLPLRRLSTMLTGMPGEDR